MTNLIRLFQSDFLKKFKIACQVLLVGLLVVYSSFHAARGEFGLLAWWNKRITLLESTYLYEQEKEKVEKLESESAYLNPQHLSLEMLEMEARKIGMGGKRDLVVKSGPKN